jgi:hypothetical protein
MKIMMGKKYKFFCCDDDDDITIKIYILISIKICSPAELERTKNESIREGVLVFLKRENKFELTEFGQNAQTKFQEKSSMNVGSHTRTYLQGRTRRRS